LALIIKDVATASENEDERFINQELTFDDIPKNGDGLTRFEKFLHK
jgi:hypothetical protein